VQCLPIDVSVTRSDIVGDLPVNLVVRNLTRSGDGILGSLADLVDGDEPSV
jgi:hypothetical protein